MNLQKKVKILKLDNQKSLEKKVLKIEHEIYPKAVDKFLSNLLVRRQRMRN